VEHTIPALVLAAILIIGGVLMAGVTSSSVDKVNQSWRDIEALSEERLGTDLTVVSTQVTGGGADVTAVLRNEGRTPVREPSLMDVIINYEGTDDQRYVLWLPYTDGALQDNTWTVTGIAGDYRNPGVLDTGEEMTIQIRLNPATKDGPDRWLVIATEAGISYSIYF
jgi:archaellum component FlaF (FlaF/FlaG flagellin family)